MSARGQDRPPAMVGRLEPQGQGGRPPAAVLLNVHPSPEELERKMASLPRPPPGDSDSISLGGARASVILCVAKGENGRLQNRSSPVASKSDLESLLCLTVNGATWMDDLNSLSSVSFSEGTFRANSSMRTHIAPCLELGLPFDTCHSAPNLQFPQSLGFPLKQNL